MKVNYAQFQRVRNGQEEYNDDAGAIVEGALTEGSITVLFAEVNGNASHSSDLVSYMSCADKVTQSDV